MSACSWWRGGHEYQWKPVTVVSRRQYVQYGVCQRCGRVKAKEVLLG